MKVLAWMLLTALAGMVLGGVAFVISLAMIGHL